MRGAPAVECSACLDALVAKRLTNAQRIADGKGMLLRIVGMLTKLVDRFDEGQARFHENPETYDDRPRPSFSSSKDDQIEDYGRARERGGEEE